MMPLLSSLVSILAAGSPSTTITVKTGAPLHEVNKMYMGCHSDSGFVHQVRGFSSQMVRHHPCMDCMSSCALCTTLAMWHANWLAD